jgi:BirA family transcriptional regulator, biotin operon repressor / biotin---[acetyl-CoA-carboxylase] ligase
VVNDVLALHFLTTTSTNDTARGLAPKILDLRAGRPFVVSADQQTQGRGQWGRKWESQAGNLFFSFVQSVPRHCDLTKISTEAPLVAAVAVGSTLKKCLSGLSSIHYKWPNDVLIDGAKVSGILIESSLGTSSDTDYIIVGCGVNVVSHPSPDLVSYPATCLQDQGATFTQDLLDHIVGSMKAYLRGWLDGGLFASILREWQDSALAVPELHKKDR